MGECPETALLWCFRLFGFDIIDNYGAALGIDPEAFAAIVADFVFIQIAYIAFAAIIAKLLGVKYTLFHTVTSL